MKNNKIIMLLMLCLAVICHAEPSDISALENVVYTDNVSCEAGSTVSLSIKMKNTVAMTGFQFDIELPTGISVTQEDDFYNIELSTERTTTKKTNYFESVLQSNGTIRVLASSTKSYTFDGNDGEVVVVELSVDDAVVEGTFPLIIKNIVMSDATSKTYVVEKIESTITIMPKTPSATIEANQFKTDHAVILGKTTSSVVSSDLNAIAAALDDYNNLSAEAKDLLTAEKNILDALKVKAEELKAAEEVADAVSTDISQMTDILYSEEVKAKSGKQVVLPIYMKNSGAVTLFQTNVYLPQGFSFAKKANGKYAVSLIRDRLTDEDDNHVISSNVQADGSLLILCSSQDNYTFDGDDGQVATVTIDVAEEVEEGQYLIKLNNQKMVRPDNTGRNVDEYQVVLTVKNYTLGDVNDDGDIDGYDLVGISNFILGTNTDGLVRDAADVNSDGDVDGYDYVMEVNTILGTNTSAAKGKNSANSLASLAVSPMDVNAGEQTLLAVGMECNGDVFTLVQTDIEFPEGVEPMLRNGRVIAKLAGECLDGSDDHSISCVKQSDGKYRILIASQDNTGFTGKDGRLFTVSIETAKDMLPGMYDITLSNTKLVRANNTGVNPSDITAIMTCNGVTGINGVEGDNAKAQLYNLNGQRVSQGAQHGIYISNGKKNVNI